MKLTVQSARTKIGAFVSVLPSDIDITAFPGNMPGESHFVVKDIKKIPEHVKSLSGYRLVGLSGCGRQSLAIFVVEIPYFGLLKALCADGRYK